ncbi:hypothetical protein AQI88_31135 [Streptomyces cellostaticus]|uniref:DUF6603 domain-containing protein n=1 Tax=Streptomyces cellostaticus TaxID=67285 RepID=A0A101NGD5_9ACTN|nr:YncE family protein [Streptomyces cellostaticus]KUM92620.1 hypothetical protein AQI88_31135 [Streptomyces cellostaticus]GHI10531.1 hypothetical protein Scel_88520 [Streptomyces cellostaticus]
MALTVAALEALLDQTRETFRLGTGELGLAGFTEQCTAYLADAGLEFTDVTVVDKPGLRVEGSVTLKGKAETRGSVTFVPDAAGATVAGVRVDAEVEQGSELLSDAAKAAVASLAVLKPSRPRLVFGEEPGRDARVAARTGVGVALDFPAADAATKPYLWAYEPADSSEAWQLGGAFPAVPLADFSSLADLAGTPGGDGFALPSDVPQAQGLSLGALSVSFGPGDGGGAAQLLSMWLRVEMNTQWALAGGQLVVHGLNAQFGVVLPRSKPRVQTVLGGEVVLANDIAVDVEIAFPDREISASLGRPVPLKPLMDRHFPGLPVPALTVEDLTLWGSAAPGASGYGVDAELSDVWQLADGVKLSRVALSAAKQGTDTTASLDALWNLDETVLDVHGEWATGTGWKLTASASNVSPADIFGRFGIAPPPILKDVTIDHIGVSYDGKDQKFHLDVTGTFPLGELKAALSLTVDLAKRSGGQPGYDQRYTGSLSLEIPQHGGEPRTMTFTLADAQHAEFTASWEDAKGVSPADLATLLGVDAPAEILAKLGSVTSVRLRYASTDKSVVFAARTVDGGSLVLVSQRDKSGGHAWVARVSVALSAALSQVPLLEGQIPADQDVAVRALGVLLASDALTAARTAELNRALAACDDKQPALPADGLGKGAAFSISLQLPGRTELTSLVVRGDRLGGAFAGRRQLTAKGPHIAGAADAAGGVNAAFTAAGPGASMPLVAWADVQRAVGPLRLRRVGVGYADGTVWVLFDASLGMAGLVLGVEGLGLGIPLAHPDRPEIRLDGLSVAYSKPPLAVKGALVNRPPDDQYALLVQGVLVLSAAKFGLSVLGAYARSKDRPDATSMFLYGKASGKFGGPPPLQITGIMAGLGFNTSVTLPDGDRVLDFPFLKDLTSTDPGTDPMEVLQTLMAGGRDAWVRPAVGQMWFAAGLEFSVAEFLQGQGLLVLEVGDDFAVALLGTADARFPRGTGKAYARAQLGLSAKYRASEGVLKLTAQLAPGSFVIDEACVLTGGFALYVWMDDAHAGDFVLTLGGYHPRFPVPKHYPSVPRLGFSWPVTQQLTISGGSYFALTPGALMAGGALDVNYRSGKLHAWLTAYADMLIEWAPFRFDVGIGISIGVSYVLDLWLVRETIRVEVGASLRLWGPPTAGEVTVHLWFISFTIAFGGGRAQDDRPAPWSEVVKQLPAREDAVRLTPMDGLSAARAEDERGRDLWIATPGVFSFAVRAAVPVTMLRLSDGDAATEIAGRAVNLRPRRAEGRDLDSALTVTLSRGSASQPLGDWYPDSGAEARNSLPAALWGPYDGKLTVDSVQWADDQLMGVDLRLPLPRQGGSPGEITAGTLAHDDRFPDGALPLRAAAVSAQAVAAAAAPAPQAAPLTVAEAVRAAHPVRAEAAYGDGSSGSLRGATGGQAAAPVDWARDRLFAAMEYLGVSPGTNDRLAADDGLVAGDITAPVDHAIPGPPVPTGDRLYAAGTGRTATPADAHSLTPYEPSRLGSASPTHLAVSPDGRRLVVIDAQQGVDILDISANPPAAAPSLLPDRLWVPQRPQGLSASPDSAYAYATFAQPNQFLAFDLTKTPPTIHQQYGTERTPGDAVASTQWDEQRQVVYLAQPEQGTVALLDVTNGKWPSPMGELSAGPNPTRLAVDPRGRWLYALNAGHSTVSVVDVRTGGQGVVATLRTGTDPSALAVSPDGARLYVANTTSGTVSVFDVFGASPQEAADPVWVGADPIALAVSPAGDSLFVARSGEKAVQVVDLSADAPTLLDITVPLTDTPVALAVTAPPAAPPSGASRTGGSRTQEAQEGGAA